MPSQILRRKRQTAATGPRTPTTPSIGRHVDARLSLILLSVTNLFAAMTTAFELGLEDVMHDLHAHSKSLGALTISIYTPGYFIGPFIVAPVSEVYGRLWPLRVAYVMFAVTLVICASSQSLTLFAIFRAIMGFAGIIFVLLGPAIVPDVIVKEKEDSL
ncbi:MFS general substrate transporter [Lentithecium fluviatile CBS 122367]|uniref:MFS general substrate transporter n=1 Tax=Lentithecium fluviatile CBS 122367 TaxID=1168545 RepID=A0A6G1J9Q4_9PLEO|nr:MFS general substrate transporter [Lentithecium fluviatile CBS 122367]